MTDITRRALRSSFVGIVALASLLFVPAGTLVHWQTWPFMGMFVITSGAITVYLATHDPKLLERRMNVGPRAEREPAQKIIMVFATLGFIAMLSGKTATAPPRFKSPRGKRSFPPVH